MRGAKLVLQAGLLDEKKSRRKIFKNGSRITPLKTTQNFEQATFGQKQIWFCLEEMLIESLMGSNIGSKMWKDVRA